MSVDDYECTHRQFVCFDFEKDDDECPMEDDVVARQKCNHRRRRGVPALIARDSTPHGEMRRRAGCRHRTALKNMGQLVDLDSLSFSLGNADGTMDEPTNGGIWTPAAKM